MDVCLTRCEAIYTYEVTREKEDKAVLEGYAGLKSKESKV